MHSVKVGLLLFAAVAILASGCTINGGTTAATPPAAADENNAAGPLDQIELPDGFEIHYFASDVSGARSLARGPQGTIFVGSREAGNVYAVVDDNGDYRAEQVITIASGRNQPNGVAMRDGSLYVAEISRVWRLDDIENRLDNPPEPVMIRDDFPTNTWHGWKFIAFGPDDRLYVPVGAPCNVCTRENPIYASITRMNPDGSNREIIAHGVRNTVGFDWNPETGVLWFTDNGRDWMGDNRPPDELNRMPETGLHFGFPFCHGTDIPDPEYNAGRHCGGYTSPVVELGPHVAALGMRFYDAAMFPDKYHGGIFIAEHGSWNRSEKIGYRVMYVPVENRQPQGLEVFAEGWLQGENAWGRPVDVLVMPDGSLLVSDDKAGAIYRIHYTG